MIVLAEDDVLIRLGAGPVPVAEQAITARPPSPAPPCSPRAERVRESGNPDSAPSTVGAVSELKGHLILALSVLVGSAIPFVPTGEMVSGAAAFASHSRLNVLYIFLITWICSTLGDTVMLVEARLGAGRLRPWLERRRFAQRVAQAQEGLTRNAFNAVVTGRLIPGGRAPVIIALGLSRYPIRRFMLYDLVACGLWAAIYSTIGSIGGRVAHHPIWAMVVAIAIAVSMGALVQQIRRFVGWRRARHQPTPDTDLA